jgi:hypothetical protein
VEIGNQRTIIEYVTDRLLKLKVQFDEIKPLPFQKLIYMSLLASGELNAATLLIRWLLAEQQGLIVIDDSTHPEYGHSTYAFRKSFIDDHPEAVCGLAAIDAATEK